MLIVRLYRDNVDIVFIRNYRHYNVSSALIEHSSPSPYPCHLLYLSNLFAHHEHHPSDDIPLSPCAPLSRRNFFYFLFPYTTGLVISRLVNLLAPDRRAVIRLCIRIRACGISPLIPKCLPSLRPLQECDFTQTRVVYSILSIWILFRCLLTTDFIRLHVRVFLNVWIFADFLNFLIPECRIVSSVSLTL